MIGSRALISRLIVLGRWVLPPVCLLLMAGVCEMEPRSEPIEFSDLVGSYAGKVHGGLMDSLWLNADSTYVRKFLSFEGRLYVDSGRWRGYSASVPFDPRSVGLEFPKFIVRYNRDSVSDSDELDGDVVADSVAGRRLTGITKETHGTTTVISLGGRYSPNWVRVFKK